jgi:hypothetical protein
MDDTQVLLARHHPNVQLATLDHRPLKLQMNYRVVHHHQYLHILGPKRPMSLGELFRMTALWAD